GFWRTHNGPSGHLGDAGDFRNLPYGLRAARESRRVSVVATGAISHSDISRAGAGQFSDSFGNWRNTVSLSPALSGGAGIFADPIGPVNDAPGDCRDELEDDNARH